MDYDHHTSTSIQHTNDSRRLKQSGGTLDKDGTGNFTFPPPATDLLSHGVASTVGVPGLWAYASGSAVVVVKSAGHEVTRDWPLFTMLDASGWDIYCSVSFCQSERGKWPIQDSPLVGATQGGLIRIFNIENHATVKFHDSHIGHKTIAEWSPRNSRFIYGMDNLGHMSIWDVVDNSCVMLSFGNFETTCMAVSPHEDDIVVFGDKEGTIRIVNTVGTGSILHYVKHFKEIFSLKWKPSGNWVTIPKLRRHNEPFLAASYTSFKHPVVKLLDREGEDIYNFCVMETGQTKLTMRSIPSIWIQIPSSADGADGDTEDQLALVSVSPEGEIVVWKESEPTTSDVVHNLQARCGIFGLIQSGNILWSISTEPFIVGWNLKTNKVEAIIPTYSGICSISYSGIESTRVAIGGVDSYIRVLKITDEYPNGKDTEMPLLPSKLQGKITAVAFHPFLDKVGFGTDSGILGVYDIKAESRYVMEFSKRSGGTIYTVDWGPKCYTADYVPKVDHDGKGKISQTFWLYVCGNRNAYAIHPGKRDNALISIGRIIGGTNSREENRINSVITELKWSPDHVYLAVGYNDGKIEVYLAPNLKLRCWIKCHSNAIQFLCWRGLDFVDEDSAHKHKYLASAANDGTAKIHDLVEIYDVDFLCNPDAIVPEFISSKIILNGHCGVRVIQVIWSPHNDNQILTVSYDTTAVLWDLSDESPTVIARYMGHEHRLVACGFHPTNPHMIFTCSDELMINSCFHMWDYRQHPEVENYQEITASKSMTGSTVECVKALAAPRPKLMFRPGSEDAAVGKDKIQNRPTRQDAEARLMSKLRDRKTLLPLLTHYKAQNTLMAEVAYIIDGTPLPDPLTLSPFEKEQIDKQRSIVKILSKVDLLVDEKELQDVAGELDSLPPDFHLQLFGSREDVQNLVEIEFEGHVKRGDFYAAVCLLGWFKNPERCIRNLIAAGHWEETMLIFAKKCSRKFFLEIVTLYAKHLASIGKITEAVFYFWNILESFEDAYDTFVKADLLIEALIFSKAHRLHDGKEEDKIVLDKLAAQLQGEDVPQSEIGRFYTVMGLDYKSPVKAYSFLS